MKKMLMLILAIIAVAIPTTTIFAVDQIDREIQIKLDLEQRELNIKEQIKSEDDSKEIKELERKAESLDIFQQMIDLKHESDIAYKNNDSDKIQEIITKSNELQSRFTELAGDRVVNATLYPEDVESNLDVQSVWRPVLLPLVAG